MRAAEILDRFDFDDQTVIDQEVDLERPGKAHPVVFDVDRHLPGDLVTTTFERGSEHRFINRFEQSRPKIPVDADSGVNDVSADLVDGRHVPPFPAPLRLCANNSLQLLR
jgi:hypothetical protein